jgi:4-amino-4-deoxy-L-arabinose transferase-like glycosyltransferase
LSKKRNKRKQAQTKSVGLLPQERPRPTPPPAGVAARGFLDQYASVLIFILILASFFINSYASDFTHRKNITTVDESVYTRLGLQLKQGEAYNTIAMYNENLKAGRRLPDYFKDPLFKHPPMFSFLISLAYTALDKKPSYSFQELYALSSKVPNVMGCLLVLVVFLIGRRLYDVRVGLLAALFMIVELNYLNCAHKVWMESTLAFFFWLSLYLFHKGTQEKWVLLLAGAAFGSAMLTKYPAVLVLPIWLTYLMLHERRLFRSLFLYLSLAVAGVIFLPWMLETIDVYGADFISGTKISSWNIVRLYGFFAVVSLAALAVLLYQLIKWKNPALLAPFRRQAHWINRAVAASVFLVVAVLFLQADFRQSMITSLTWFGFPETGWEVGGFNVETRYFYLKRLLLYSPVYLFFLIGAVRAPLGGKNGQFLLISAFWTLLFTSLYGSFQGRYMLYVMPAALLLASATAVEVFDQILQEKSALRWLAALAFALVLVFFFAKTLQVGLYHAINNNVAYY